MSQLGGQRFDFGRVTAPFDHRLNASVGRLARTQAPGFVSPGVGGDARAGQLHEVAGQAVSALAAVGEDRQRRERLVVQQRRGETARQLTGRADDILVQMEMGELKVGSNPGDFLNQIRSELSEGVAEQDRDIVDRVMSTRLFGATLTKFRQDSQQIQREAFDNAQSAVAMSTDTDQLRANIDAAVDLGMTPESAAAEFLKFHAASGNVAEIRMAAEVLGEDNLDVRMAMMNAESKRRTLDSQDRTDQIKEARDLVTASFEQGRDMGSVLDMIEDIEDPVARGVARADAINQYRREFLGDISLRLLDHTEDTGVLEAEALAAHERGWVDEGTAAQALSSIRREDLARGQLAIELLEANQKAEAVRTTFGDIMEGRQRLVRDKDMHEPLLAELGAHIDGMTNRDAKDATLRFVQNSGIPIPEWTDMLSFGFGNVTRDTTPEDVAATSFPDRMGLYISLRALTGPNSTWIADMHTSGRARDEYEALHNYLIDNRLIPSRPPADPDAAGYPEDYRQALASGLVSFIQEEERRPIAGGGAGTGSRQADLPRPARHAIRAAFGGEVAYIEALATDMIKEAMTGPNANADIVTDRVLNDILATYTPLGNGYFADKRSHGFATDEEMKSWVSIFSGFVDSTLDKETYDDFSQDMGRNERVNGHLMFIPTVNEATGMLLAEAAGIGRSRVVEPLMIDAKIVPGLMQIAQELQNVSALQDSELAPAVQRGRNRLSINRRSELYKREVAERGAEAVDREIAEKRAWVNNFISRRGGGIGEALSYIPAATRGPAWDQYRAYTARLRELGANGFMIEPAIEPTADDFRVRARPSGEDMLRAIGEDPSTYGPREMALVEYIRDMVPIRSPEEQRDEAMRRIDRNPRIGDTILPDPRPGLNRIRNNLDRFMVRKFGVQL